MIDNTFTNNFVEINHSIQRMFKADISDDLSISVNNKRIREKQSTIVLGECGRMPPSVTCTINTQRFLNRLRCMDGDSLAKQVHDELYKSTDQGFVTWICSIGKSADTYQLYLYMDPVKF